jgi:hypothetical protein
MRLRRLYGELARYSTVPHSAQDTYRETRMLCVGESLCHSFSMVLRMDHDTGHDVTPPFWVMAVRGVTMLRSMSKP